MTSDLPGVDPRFDPAFQRGFAQAAPGPAPAPTLRGNPWVVVLWALAVLLTGGGLWAFWQSQTSRDSQGVDSVPSDYVLPVLLEGVAPWLLLVGLATLVATVFLYAVRWRKG